MFSSKVALNYSQDYILTKIASFLEQTNHIDLMKDIILSKGYCNGFATLFLYCAWLETQPKKLGADGKNIPRDDLTWFKNIITTLAAWDGKLSSLCPAKVHEIHRFIQLLEFQQNSSNYIYASHQNHIHDLINDSLQRSPRLEYTLAGLFSADDLSSDTKLETKLPILFHIAQENRLVLIQSDDHAIGLFLCGGIFKLYDANHSEMLYRRYKLNEVKKLAHAIVNALLTDDNEVIAMGFRVYSFETKSANYVAQASILQVCSQIDTNLTPKRLTGLHMATIIRCQASCEYYSKQDIDINQLDSSGYTALHTAIAGNYHDIASYLLQAKVDVNIGMTSDNATALHIAAENNNERMIDLLLQYGANPHLKLTNNQMAHELTESPNIKIKLMIARSTYAAPSTTTSTNNATLFSKNYIPIYSPGATEDTENHCKRFKTK